jgi:ribonucleoside-diphosphate reductase alpha chain
MEKTSGKGLANGHSNGRALDQVSGPQLPATADFSAPKTSLEGPPGELKVTVPRRYTKPGINPLDALHWTRRKSVIADPDGTVVFKMDDAEVPEDWSQLATDVAVSKYFRKAGVPGTDHEKSVRQLVERVAKTIRSEGVLQGLLATPEIADTFEAELSYMLIHQIGAFNSPVWFNCGLYHQYGITGSGGNFAWDEAQNKIVETADAYSRPQVSACFIQSVADDLTSIFELVKNESRVFKFGSGTGTNFSKLRGDMEKLSGGGMSSGLMSFLEVLDRGAGATKSGGTTRRAAKMVVVDMDHPEIDKFITWKKREEKKVAALIAGGYSSDFNGEAYRTVAGQNSNNSVRVSDAFMKAVETDGEWSTTLRNGGAPFKTYKARDLWRLIADASWHCADPGMQFDDTINQWHTCKATDRIYASNPCVTGDTLVATAQGPQRIDSLLGASTEVVGADGRLHPIEPAFQTGVKPVYRLRTNAGFELKLTGDHKVFTLNRGDVPACELTRDDRLALGRPTFGQNTLDERLGEFLGLVTGDGCLMGDQQTAMLTLSPTEEALASTVHARLSAFKKEHAADGRAARDIEVTKPQGTIRLGTNARCVVDELQRYAILDQGSEKKAFTAAVFGLDQRSTAAILRGLFTADGTVANYGEKSQYVALDSTSLTLLQQVQQQLLGFGIKAKLYRDRRVMGQTMALLPDGKGGRKEYPIQQMHSLRISRSSRLVFEKEIGFVSGSDKVAQLAEMNRAVTSYADRFDDRVESMELLGEQPVFDLTEPVTHHFVANGLVVHNCSEYMFLDDTACNLSSVNLLKFLDQDGKFDTEGYRHACRVFFLAQEILVDLASYPTAKIAERSHQYRTLGLGFANLGTLLMVKGLPYDSDAGRDFAAALTSLMTGEAYALSAEMAAVKGPFPGYKPNRESMLGVIKMHTNAAYAIPTMHVPEDLIEAARECWDRAYAFGEQWGFRNAQATVLAPTGTIGLLMDCDTTGVEPDFALVKFKKLAGGGYWKIVNQSVPWALKSLGYDQATIDGIIRYAVGTCSLDSGPHIHRTALAAKGLLPDELNAVERALKGCLDLRAAFAPHVVGAAAMERLGVPEKERKSFKFDLLGFLGFSKKEINEANDVLCGRQTVEGAPGIKPQHLAVFDCANRCGPYGQRYIEPMGHIRMMGAVQPFLSGAISKTINIPNEATIEDVEHIHTASWKLGLKAIALYRDGSKLSQPLNVKEKNKEEPVAVALPAPLPVAAAPVAVPAPKRKLGASPPPLERHRLPTKRIGVTQEAKIGGLKMFLRTGEYADGKLGEIFIDMHKEGAAYRSLLNCFSMLTSIALQYGVPLEVLVDQFIFTRFEPQGPVVGHERVKFATSVIDYVFRSLGVEYLGRNDLAHVPASEQAEPSATVDSPALRAAAAATVSEVAAPVEAAAPPEAAPESVKTQRGGGGQDALLGELSGDAPFCDTCGHITVRNGACFKCLNCGTSMGCS